MLRFLYYIYFIEFDNHVIDSYYKRICIRVINTTLYVHYLLTGSFTKSRKIKEKAEHKVIVSLTSYPKRIDKLWLVIETLLDQTLKPDAIMLWLSREEFSREINLPKKLKDLKNRGLKIKFSDENLMPHKKYYYTMRNHPESKVITVDDDMLFHPRLIENLLAFHDKYPEAICCSILREIKVEDGKIMPYEEWKSLKKSSEPTFKNHLMGGGGTLFPIDSLDEEVFNKDSIIKNALQTDDMWLKIMSLKKGTKVASVAGKYKRYFVPLIHKDDGALMDKNIGLNKNDKVFKNIMDYYNMPENFFARQLEDPE